MVISRIRIPRRATIRRSRLPCSRKRLSAPGQRPIYAATAAAVICLEPAPRVPGQRNFSDVGYRFFGCRISVVDSARVSSPCARITPFSTYGKVFLRRAGSDGRLAVAGGPCVAGPSAAGALSEGVGGARDAGELRGPRGSAGAGMRVERYRLASWRCLRGQNLSELCNAAGIGGGRFPVAG
jgi:hypothetical protein